MFRNTFETTEDLQRHCRRYYKMQKAKEMGLRVGVTMAALAAGYFTVKELKKAQENAA